MLLIFDSSAGIPIGTALAQVQRYVLICVSLQILEKKALLIDQEYQACCERGSTPIYRTALCSGLYTTARGSIPDYCVGFSTSPGTTYTPCQCSCNAKAASEDNSGNVCLNCDAVSGLQLRGASVWDITGASKRSLDDLAALGDLRCTSYVEPDVLQIDGRYFRVGEKHGVPSEIRERFWDIFINQQDIKFDAIPEDLKQYLDMNIVAPLTADELRRAAARTLIIHDEQEQDASLRRRQGLPAQCPAS
ncbi:hypothetical protein D6D04_03989 [Aureobasidium pullulans]|nr:hypothetical protein D6D04_03989 [Aureobasidium pullulans]